MRLQSPDSRLRQRHVYRAYPKYIRLVENLGWTTSSATEQPSPSSVWCRPQRCSAMPNQIDRPRDLSPRWPSDKRDWFPTYAETVADALSPGRVLRESTGQPQPSATD